jgi:VCBS repeat-containing protein
MTVAVANVANTNTFDYWRNRTNELATAMSNVVVSTGSTTTGNADITGSFTANVLIANTVRVSNSTVNVVISVPTSVQIANGSFFLNANGSWSSAPTPLANGTLTTTGTGAQLLDSFAISTTRGAEYFISIRNNNANAYQATKVLTMHNNVAAFSTEYATMLSNTSLGVFDANVAANATHVTFYITPTSSNTTVNFTKVTF